MKHEVIWEKIHEIFPKVVDIRRHFHEYPELSQEEFKTCQYIMDYLDMLEIPYERVCGNGVVATIYGNGKSDITVGIRGDIDALPISEETGLSYASKVPGVMHACGHDMHGACLLGTAAVLNQIKAQLKGNVKLFFQPAEETVGGALPMIEAGCLDKPNVNAVLGFHIEEKIPLGCIEMTYGAANASTTEFEIIVNGKACHGAHPDLGIDAIVISANIITALQTIISRSIDPVDALVITIGTINGGTKENVITGEVRMTGTIRSLDLELRDFAKEKMANMASSIAQGYGGTCHIEFIDSYPPLVNDFNITSIMEDLSRKTFGDGNTIIKKKASLGADDFAFFCQKRPSAYINIGATDFSKGTPYPAHSPGFNPEEDSMKNLMFMEVAGAIELMERL